MKRLLRSAALLITLALGGCASDPATFTTFTHRDGSPKGAVPAAVAPHYTDALALNYANFVESEFRARATGARYTREGSNTAVAGLSGFTAAAGTLAYSASTVTGLGMATAGIVQLQHIFDAKGRANAYAEAAVRIHAAIKDFVALNLNHVSETDITPNGWTLANIVQANADMVDKVLNGHLPTPEDLVQASEPMTPRGATPQATGTEPMNNISAIRNALPAHLKPKTTTTTPPPADSGRGLSTELRKGRSALSEQVVLLRGKGDHERARAILTAHQTPIVADEDPIETLGNAVSAIRSRESLQGWQEAFSTGPAHDVRAAAASGDANPGQSPAHLKPRETTTTPETAPRRP